MHDRHPSGNAKCSLIEKIIIGRCAQELLDQGVSGDVGLVILPVWGWAPPKINVGRKNQRAGEPDRPYLMHVRLDYSQGPLMLINKDESTDVTWFVSGLGHHGQGKLEVNYNSSPGELLDGTVEPLGPWGPSVRGSAPVKNRLTRLARDGHLSYFQMLRSIERDVHLALNAANVDVARKLQGEQSIALHPGIIEDLVTEMTYGAEGSQGLSQMQRLVERCLNFDQFAKVDLTMYLYTSVSRDSGKAIRDRLGDPHVGQKIRAVAKELHPDPSQVNMEELLKVYKERYPKDHVSYRRAEAALNVRVSPDAVSLPLLDFDLRTED